MTTATITRTDEPTKVRMDCQDCQARTVGEQRAPENARTHAIKFPGHRVRLSVVSSTVLSVELPE